MSVFSRIVCIFLFFLSFICCASAETKQMLRQTDAYFSTVSMLVLYDDASETARFSETWTHVKSILAEIDEAVSLSHPDSDISRFNRLSCEERISISPVTAEILSTAFDVYRTTDGLYDPTVYPLVDLWGFSPRFNTNVYTPSMPYDRAYESGVLPLPDAKHIQALLPLIGLSGVSLIQEDGTWYLEKNTPSVILDGVTIHAQLDLGGIAKGYACDRVMEFLRERGYTMGHFVCGGSSMSILSRPTENGLAALTLGKPRPGKSSTAHYATVRVRDTTLSTSSDASHAHVYDGVRYCHIIDPRTGWPSATPCSGIQQGTASVTLLSQSAARSDAMTTALFLMPPQEACAFINRSLTHDRVVVSLFHAGFDTFEVITNIPEGGLTIDDPSYRIASSLEDGGVVRYTGAFFSP